MTLLRQGIALAIRACVPALLGALGSLSLTAFPAYYRMFCGGPY